MPTVTEQKCNGCGITKSASEFFSDRRRVQGIGARCKVCVASYAKQYRKDHHEQIKSQERDSYYRIPDDPERKLARLRLRFKTGLKHVFGIDVETYARMANDQNLRCANDGCRSPLLLDSDTHIDHCHRTGEIRGLLCRACNMLLGCSGESESRLTGAIAYLKAHGTLLD